MLGKTIAHYEILEPLGSGGMAEVYLAHDTKHGRHVAIKVLREEATASIGTERFLEEIQITANLQHPHILQLFDSGEIDGRPYYVMPWVEGESLRERLRRGRLPVDEALEISRQVGSALQYAHQHDIVHRDIKPENIMLLDGQAMAADFGVARALADEDRTRLTAVGLSVGTPAYMSPEQAAGDYDIDARADVYALGVVLYEMLVGSPPFGGETAGAILSKVLTESPPSLASVRATVPEAVAGAIETAMAKNPADRQASVSELLAALESGRSDAVPAPGFSSRAKVAVALVAVAVLALAGTVLYRSRATSQERDWARVEAIPQVQDFLNEAEIVAAYELASRALDVLPDDPTLAGLLDAASGTVDIDSEPTGATVSYRPYDGGDWVELGRTPLPGMRLPRAELAVRTELDGYATDHRILLPSQPFPLRVRLEAQGRPGDMVWVPAGSYALGVEPVQIADFRIDRTEVTNAAFQRFVDAGGYRDAAGWEALFAPHDVAIDGERAAAAFVDATGRPGPAGWELSRHAGEHDDHPVGGVSWFEAAAFCEWAGKSLPTFYHWKLAAGLDVRDNMVAASNLAASGPGPGPIAVGSTASFGINGTVDMAGNVREWVWNASREGRYILGGAWDSQPFLYTNYEAADPWSRDAVNGFRCAQPDAEAAAGLLAAIDEPFFDFTDYTPVDDETFALYSSLYDYDFIELDAERTLVEENDNWTRELVEITAAYSGERIPLHIFLPTNAAPPYQTVVYFPGVTALYLSSSENLAERSALMFLPRSGRALVYPVVKHSYERRKPDDVPRTPTVRRQEAIWMTQDIMRAVDYAFERPDLDETKLAYMGLSYGAELAVPPALEKRFGALVLIGAALDAAWKGFQPEEAAPWNFVYRITTPTILINGGADVMHPYNEGQLPFFNAIDVPEEDKRFVVSSGGHLPDWNEVIRHTLDWLDERLGPVATAARR